MIVEDAAKKKKKIGMIGEEVQYIDLFALHTHNNFHFISLITDPVEVCVWEWEAK